NLYTAGEKVNSLAMLLGKEYPQENINKSWENILLNQFHDIIPGSSIKEVYDVTKEEYKELLENVDNIIDEGIEEIAKNIELKDRSLILTNTLGFDRDDIATFEIPEDMNNPALIDSEGNEILCQRIDDNKALAFVKNIPANG